MSECYLVSVFGCDASTRVVVVLSESQATVLERIADRVNEIGEQIACGPTIGVELLHEADDDDVDRAVGSEFAPVCLDRAPRDLTPFVHLHVKDECVKNRFDDCIY